jgi:hypothetical protein
VEKTSEMRKEKGRKRKYKRKEKVICLQARKNIGGTVLALFLRRRKRVGAGVDFGPNLDLSVLSYILLLLLYLR